MYRRIVKTLTLSFLFFYKIAAAQETLQGQFQNAENLNAQKKFIEAEKIYAQIYPHVSVLSLSQQQLFFLHWGKGLYWRASRDSALIMTKKTLLKKFPEKADLYYECYSRLGAIYREKGMTDSAIINLKYAEGINESKKLNKYHAKFILAQIYTDQAKYTEGLKHSIDALKIAESLPITIQTVMELHFLFHYRLIV
jgi:tetratricopeptide (TPR) repeat protein